MTPIATAARVRIAGLILTALTLGLTSSRADVIQSTVVLPPASGAYSLGGVCITALDRCVEDAVITDFVTTSDTEVGGNEVVVVDAVDSAEVFVDNSGVPGMFVGDLMLTGTADIKYIGRNPSINPLGIFTTDITSFDFSGMLHGNTFTVKQNPLMPSTGTTSIFPTSLTPPFFFSVSSSIDLNGEYSLNDSPFVAAPTRMGTLFAIPEPSSAALLGSALAGLLALAARRRNR